MTEKLLNVRAVAKMIGRTIGTTQNLMIEADFPPPREYGRYGRKFYAREDIEFWQEERAKARRRK